MVRILAVTNMYPSFSNPQSGTFVEQQINGLRQVGLNVKVMYVDRLQYGMRAYVLMRQQLTDSIAEFKPDVIHIMYGGVMADIVTKNTKDIPTIVSFCGSDILGEPFQRPLRRLISGYGVYCSYRAARQAWGLIVKSKNLLDALPNDISHEKVRIIPNGINLQRFKPLDQRWCREQLNWENDSFHILFPTNSGDPCKRLDLAKAAVEVYKKSDSRVILHELKGVGHDEVPIWLNASDAAILTSVHEGSPNFIKEALACNVPIVSVDVGDVVERIQEVQGCFLAKGNPCDIASKLHLVRTGLKRVGGRSAMETLSLEAIALRLKEFYEETLALKKLESEVC